jgi:hypothetical protein
MLCDLGNVPVRMDTVSLGNIWVLRLESVFNRPDANFAAILEGEFGWGGRIRTFTVLINSEVSYRLDHAPAAFCYFAAFGAKLSPAARSR